MNKTFMLTGVIMGLLAIVLGAFGAHGLEKVVSPDAVDSFETGVRYQMYHALLLLILGIWNGLEPKQNKIIYGFILLGTILFSFSIYFLAIDNLMTFDFKRIAFSTPIGGTLLILAWGLLGYNILTKK
ncbi:DUF423 domain-containing protein [Flagellimonas myxillae]|uniref:DUF423 domain-containing protein n=1 Tax=Flagellimonas myxillae TaxID=2942214 RepID=UPI00201F9087|nr:DUF423 domain-containing protein [Muricauda myxillae]MCL6267552.1 DUF423 domain-containing protein [Muricauda myxillae]